MNKYIKSVVVIAFLAIISGCAGVGPVTAPTRAPSSGVGIVTQPETDQRDQMQADFNFCREAFGGKSDKESLKALDVCNKAAIKRAEAVVKADSTVVRNDQKYRQLSQRELDAEQRRREKALRANTRALQDLVKTAEKAIKIFD